MRKSSRNVQCQAVLCKVDHSVKGQAVLCKVGRNDSRNAMP